MAFLCSAAASADDLPPADMRYGWTEVWTGADATRDVWLLYSGVTLAPYSADIYSDGLRLRASTGFGQYSYRGSAPGGGERRYRADTAYGTALAGYQFRTGSLTTKVFAGIGAVSHAIRPFDRTSDIDGTAYGPAGALELWFDLGTTGWVSLDVGYTTAHDTGSGRARAGFMVWPGTSIGPEVRYDTNAEDGAARAGLFARYAWDTGEVSIASGVGGELTGGVTDDADPYLTVNILFQY